MHLDAAFVDERGTRGALPAAQHAALARARRRAREVLREHRAMRTLPLLSTTSCEPSSAEKSASRMSAASASMLMNEPNRARHTPEILAPVRENTSTCAPSTVTVPVPATFKKKKSPSITSAAP